MVQIKRIGIKQTAKVFAVFYFFISLVFVLPISLITILIGSFSKKDTGVLPTAFGGVFFLILPLIYAAMGFIMVAVSAALYNLIAKYVGGIEIELNSEETREITPP